MRINRCIKFNIKKESIVELLIMSQILPPLVESSDLIIFSLVSALLEHFLNCIYSWQVYNIKLLYSLLTLHIHQWDFQCVFFYF